MPTCDATIVTTLLLGSTQIAAEYDSSKELNEFLRQTCLPRLQRQLSQRELVTDASTVRNGQFAVILNDYAARDPRLEQAEMIKFKWQLFCPFVSNDFIEDDEFCEEYAKSLPVPTNIQKDGESPILEMLYNMIEGNKHIVRGPGGLGTDAKELAIKAVNAFKIYVDSMKPAPSDSSIQWNFIGFSRGSTNIRRAIQYLQRIYPTYYAKIKSINVLCFDPVAGWGNKGDVDVVGYPEKVSIIYTIIATHEFRGVMTGQDMFRTSLASPETKTKYFLLPTFHCGVTSGCELEGIDHGRFMLPIHIQILKNMGCQISERSKISSYLLLTKRLGLYDNNLFSHLPYSVVLEHGDKEELQRQIAMLKSSKELLKRLDVSADDKLMIVEVRRQIKKNISRLMHYTYRYQLEEIYKKWFENEDGVSLDKILDLIEHKDLIPQMHSVQIGSSKIHRLSQEPLLEVNQFIEQLDLYSRMQLYTEEVLRQESNKATAGAVHNRLYSDRLVYDTEYKQFYVAQPDFFISQHHREVFKIAYPKVFAYFFENKNIDICDARNFLFNCSRFLKEALIKHNLIKENLSEELVLTYKLCRHRMSTNLVETCSLLHSLGIRDSKENFKPSGISDSEKLRNYLLHNIFKLGHEHGFSSKPICDILQRLYTHHDDWYIRFQRVIESEIVKIEEVEIDGRLYVPQEYYNLVKGLKIIKILSVQCVEQLHSDEAPRRASEVSDGEFFRLSTDSVYEEDDGNAAADGMPPRVTSSQLTCYLQENTFSDIDDVLRGIQRRYKLDTSKIEFLELLKQHLQQEGMECLNVELTMMIAEMDDGNTLKEECDAAAGDSKPIVNHSQRCII